jgi:hypothetical protein
MRQKCIETKNEEFAKVLRFFNNPLSQSTIYIWVLLQQRRIYKSGNASTGPMIRSNYLHLGLFFKNA